MKSTLRKSTQKTYKNKSKRRNPNNESKDYLSRQKQKSIFKMIRKKQESKKDKNKGKNYRTRDKSHKRMDYSNVESVSRSISRSGVKVGRMKSSNVIYKRPTKKRKGSNIDN